MGAGRVTVEPREKGFLRGDSVRNLLVPISGSSEVVVGGWLQLDARREASGGGVEVEGAADRFPTGADVWRRLPVEKCELIACAMERNPIYLHGHLDRGARGEREGIERGESLEKNPNWIDAKRDSFLWARSGGKRTHQLVYSAASQECARPGLCERERRKVGREARRGEK